MIDVVQIVFPVVVFLHGLALGLDSDYLMYFVSGLYIISFTCFICHSKQQLAQKDSDQSDGSE